MKKSFILYLDQYKPIEKLSIEQKGLLFDSVFKYHMGEEVVFDDPILEMAFSFFKITFDRDIEKYENICERNRINGLKGGRPNNPEEPKEPSGFLENPNNPEEPKKADSDNDNDNDNVNNIPYGPIIEYLNKISGKNFSSKAKGSKSLIKARWNEGRRIEDFFKVIKNKSGWATDEKMIQYLRPETLFCSKHFESYLNDIPPKVKEPKYVNLFEK